MTCCKPVDAPISTFKVTILSDPLFSDPTRFRQLWVPFNILHVRDQVSVLLLIEFVSLCMLLQIHIGVLLNAFCIIYAVRLPMVSISLAVPHLLSMVLQMRIEQVVLMIASP